MVDGVQAYIAMVSGLTKTTRAKAVATAKALLAQTGLEEVAADASERVSKLAEEILAAGRANRELLEHLVATEVEKATARLGFARAEDLEALRREIAELRLGLAHQSAQTAAKSAPRKSPGTKASATKAAAKKAPVKRAPVKKTAAESGAGPSATSAAEL